jgi:uncharacterized repeat protein (TIGR01451 family)
MKKLLPLVILVLFFAQAKAQYVNITDTAFASFLKTKYPAAMSGTMLDTTNTNIINDTSLNCNYKHIYDLNGVQYFDNLKYLYCNSNNLSSLPKLPNNLLELECDNNLLATLPSLPLSLKKLYCSANTLTSLPALPGTITKLWCQINSLSSLPALPGSLQELRCYRNNLTSLPTLPSSLVNLECAINSLSSLPALPASLTNLYCSSNNLSSLPSLPGSLKSLDCSSNNLSALPSLPGSLSALVCISNILSSLPALPGTLTILSCQFNNLTTLPTLPSNLKRLVCSHNSLLSLPTLPGSLTSLECQNNYITTLPLLPNLLDNLDCSANRLINITNIPIKLDNFYCQDNPYLTCLPLFSKDSFTLFQIRKGTNISCLPKLIYSRLDYDSTSSLPLCGTASSCSISYNILGNVHQDTSATCLLDSLSNGNKSHGIKLLKYKNGVLNQQSYTNAKGIYIFDADISDSIDIFIDTAGQAFSLSCPPSGRRSARITTSDSMFYYQDFGIKCKGSGIDLSVSSINGTFRKGFTRPLNVYVGDFTTKFKLNCAMGKGGTVTTSISGSAAYLAPQSDALTPSSVSGGTITYSIADFGKIDFNKAFNIYVKVDSAAVLGSSICIHTVVSTSAVDLNHSNDTLTFCGNVVNSFDPNEKLVYPAETIGPNEWLTYTINFQNTGTDTAYNIIVRDTLDSHLDISSFTYLASSHKPQVNVAGNAVTFNFPNINLLDSLHNEPESHGWLQYKIKTLSSLPTFANVNNKASIYFDDNYPIVTNTTSNVNPPLSINYNSRNAHFKLYPNPTSSIITIEATEAGAFKIFNMLGAVIYSSTIQKPNSSVSISLPPFADGLYIYQFISDKGASNTGKLYLQSK